MIDRVCISLNARCNLKCVYCHFANKKNNGSSKLNEFRVENINIVCTNIYKYIKENNIQFFKIGIVGSGEPLLSFNSLRAIVCYFANSDLNKRVKMYVISNGVLLNDEVVEFFYKYKDIIELNISLDGDYEINTKLRGCFPDLTLYRKKFGEMPKINAVVTKEIILNHERILSYFVDNGFYMINFSKIFATNDPNIAISDDEYNDFLKAAQLKGITSRQNSGEKKYDCAKYGRLCGVGRNNIFITKTGIYPCGRFMNIKEYVLGAWNESMKNIENKLSKYHPCPDGQCYFDYYKVEK